MMIEGTAIISNENARENIVAPFLHINSRSMHASFNTKLVLIEDDEMGVDVDASSNIVFFY